MKTPHEFGEPHEDDFIRELARDTVLSAIPVASGPAGLLGWKLAHALVSEGWRPPVSRTASSEAPPPASRARQSAGGKVSGVARGAQQAIRRALVASIVDGLPATYRDHPRSDRTLARVKVELEKIAAGDHLSKRMRGWATASSHTVRTDIDALGFRAGAQRTRRLSK